MEITTLIVIVILLAWLLTIPATALAGAGLHWVLFRFIPQ